MITKTETRIERRKLAINKPNLGKTLRNKRRYN